MESGISEMEGKMGKWHSKALENKGTWCTDGGNTAHLVMDKGVGGSLSQVSNRKKGKMGKVAGKFIDLVTEN